MRSYPENGEKHRTQDKPHSCWMRLLFDLTDCTVLEYFITVLT